MKTVKTIAVVVAFTAALTALSTWPGSAGEAPGFISVDASKLKWTDAPSVGPGAKIAVLEGDLKSSEPFTFASRFLPTRKSASTRIRRPSV